MRIRHLVLAGVAGFALAGCGSGAGTKTAATTTARRPAAPPPAARTAAKPKKATPSSPAARPHGPVLPWIRRLQRDLTALHLYSGPIDGRESGLVTAAIVRFQRRAHLKPDGIWGPRSQAALDRMLHRKPKAPASLGWIRRLQRDLTRLHFYSGPITGVETPATKNAVIRFQRAAHLKADGLWGPRSQAALDRMLHRR